MADFSTLLKTTLKAPGVTSAGAALIPATPRKRAAVVGHDAFMVLDTYQAARPALFWSGVSAALGGALMLYLRRRRGTEAWMTWGSVSTLGLGLAWVTRPGASGSAPQAAGGKPGASVDPMAATYRWLDKRAAELDRKEPGWEDRALARLLG